MKSLKNSRVAAKSLISGVRTDLNDSNGRDGKGSVSIRPDDQHQLLRPFPCARIVSNCVSKQHFFHTKFLSQTLIFGRRFSSEKCPTLTVASFISFFFVRLQSHSDWATFLTIETTKTTTIRPSPVSGS